VRADKWGWEGCTHHIKDVFSFADIDDFLKRQRNLHDEPVEDRYCGHWPCRWANDRSRAHYVRYGVTLLRSAQNSNVRRMNRHWGREVPDDLPFIYSAMQHFIIDKADVSLIAILQSHPWKMSCSSFIGCFSVRTFQTLAFGSCLPSLAGSANTATPLV
jgi:hypothetical protein